MRIRIKRQKNLITSFILSVIYLLHQQFLPLQTREHTHLNDTSVHQVAKSTVALTYTALLSSRQASGHGFTSVTGWATRPVALQTCEMSYAQIRCLCWLIYKAYCDCVTVRTARSSFLAVSDGFMLGFMLGFVLGFIFGFVLGFVFEQSPPT